jgi:antitoxin component HigA of HigAB toxin-antitoxin module
MNSRRRDAVSLPSNTGQGITSPTAPAKQATKNKQETTKQHSASVTESSQTFRHNFPMSRNQPTAHTKTWLVEATPDSADQREYAEQLAIVRGIECISEAIEASGLSRSEVAEKLGCHKSIVTRILNGPQNMTLATLGAVLWACDRELGEFMSTPLGESPIFTSCGSELSMVTNATVDHPFISFNLSLANENVALSA